MICYDFDGQFAQYLRAWLAKHEDDFENADAAEAMMPDVYAAFLDTPASWLQGKKPGEFFNDFNDPVQLVAWMEAYLRSDIDLPDMLLNRISDLGEIAAPALMAALTREDTGNEERMLCVTLLREIGSALPLSTYIAWQLARTYEDELCDNAAESLEEMGEVAVPHLLEALPEANDAGREALLALLSRFPGDARIYDGLIDLFHRYPVRQAVLAAYLGRLGDVRAIDALRARALDAHTGYLDFIELRSAIEQLGGEAPEREFDEDPEYEALFGTGQ
ncbi:MAG: HEAT repeat domain-containing protein [Christensenellales bacterium]